VGGVGVVVSWWCGGCSISRIPEIGDAEHLRKGDDDSKCQLIDAGKTRGGTRGGVGFMGLTKPKGSCKGNPANAAEKDHTA